MLEKKLCRLVNEYGSHHVSKTKLRANVGKSKVMSFSRKVNVGQIDVGLNGKLLEEVDCLKYLESQVVADGGCKRDVAHRMNEGDKEC